MNTFCLAENCLYVILWREVYYSSWKIWRQWKVKVNDNRLSAPLRSTDYEVIHSIFQCGHVEVILNYLHDILVQEHIFTLFFQW